MSNYLGNIKILLKHFLKCERLGAYLLVVSYSGTDGQKQSLAHWSYAIHYQDKSIGTQLFN